MFPLCIFPQCGEQSGEIRATWASTLLPGGAGGGEGGGHRAVGNNPGPGCARGLVGIGREDKSMRVQVTRPMGDVHKGRGPVLLRCLLPSGPGLEEALSYLMHIN